MKTDAAIKRASQQARNAMRELDAASVDALVEMYQGAADQVRAAIQSRVDASDTVPQQQLTQLLRQVEDIVAGLGRQRDELLASQIEQAATLGVRPYTAQGVGAVGGSQAVLDSAAATLVSQAAVRFVLEFTAADGLDLSARLWRLDQGAKLALTQQIGLEEHCQGRGRLHLQRAAGTSRRGGPPGWRQGGPAAARGRPADQRGRRDLEGRPGDAHRDQPRPRRGLHGRR
ncbi:MAG: hypothetical protein ABL896_06995 [Hylemonella sp.]